MIQYKHVVYLLTDRVLHVYINVGYKLSQSTNVAGWTF